MVKACGIVILLALGGCSGMPQGSSASSSTPTCSTPSAYQCQVEMYMKAGG